MSATAEMAVTVTKRLDPLRFFKGTKEAFRAEIKKTHKFCIFRRAGKDTEVCNVLDATGRIIGRWESTKVAWHR